MKAQEALKLVFGSTVVYVVMAACASSVRNPGFDPHDDSGAAQSSGSSGSASPGSSGGGSPGSSTGGSGSGSGGTDGSGILDALTDPVSPASADTTTSGSRLKAKNYLGADGSKQFVGWHDSMLNVDCYFVLASDGTTRCLPTYPVAALVIGSYFSDSGCRQPLAEVSPKGCSAPSYASESVAGSGACSVALNHVFQLGTPYAGPIYSGSPASCTAQSDAGASIITAAYDVYGLGAELPPTTFVSATIQTDP